MARVVCPATVADCSSVSPYTKSSHAGNEDFRDGHHPWDLEHPLYAIQWSSRRGTQR